MRLSIATEAEKLDYLKSNTVLFAQQICRVFNDMAQLDFTVQIPSLASDHPDYTGALVIFSPIFGTITGQFTVAMEPAASHKLAEVCAAANERYVSGILSPTFRDFLKEALNTAVGHSLNELEACVGALNHLSPTIISGEVEFPDVRTAHIQISGPIGSMICACSLNMTNLRIAEKLEKAQNKLMRVHELQNSMLIQPADEPAARFCVYYKTIDEAGGDFYDIIKISDEEFAYFVADVAGHDIGVGFLTASVRALLKQNCTSHFTPSESMRTINNVLCDLLTPSEYVTACYAVLNRRTGTLSAVTMGHPPILFVPRSGDPKLLDTGGFILGSSRNENYPVTEIKVAAGDRVVLYTDGLVEGVLGSMWTDAAPRLLEFAPIVQDSSLESIATSLYAEIFSNGAKGPKDDIVICGIEV